MSRPAIVHSYPLVVRNCGLFSAFGLLPRSLPYALIRFALLRYFLHLIECGRVAVPTQLIVQGRVGNVTESMFAYGRRRPLRAGLTVRQQEFVRSRPGSSTLGYAIMRISVPEHLVKVSDVSAAAARPTVSSVSYPGQRIEQHMQGPFRLVALIIGVISVVPLNASAQPAPAGQLAPETPEQSTLSEGQLDQLTAPIALYSDPLVGQILTAASYPREIVEAQRWLQDPANAALKGDALAAALQEQSWDLSVKSLVPFPQILQMMDSNLEWTERIGDAFVAQQDAVMDSIQRLRHRAAAAGSLTSTPQQTVSTEDQDIAIEPASPNVVYVPYYDPNVIYGPWPWPDYSPFYFLPPPGIVIGSGLWIGFGIGFPILGPFWGWNRWDWGHHRLDLVGGRAGVRTGPWEHDPAHRHGVPYRNGAVAARFQGLSEATRRDVRGFPPPAVGERGGAASARGAAIAPRETPTRTATPAYRAAPPAFESFGGRSQVRQESQRGAYSRSAPAPRSAPSSRGGGSRSR